MSTLVPTDEISDPSWNDIFDRDKKIKELEADLRAKNAQLLAKDEAIAKLIEVMS